MGIYKKMKPDYEFKTAAGQLPREVAMKIAHFLSVSDVKSALRRMSTRTGGRMRDVWFQNDNGVAYWSAEPQNRQRLDHYVGSNHVNWDDDFDDEGWDSDGWEEDYSGPLGVEVTKILDAKFGKGTLSVEIGEKGHVDVQVNVGHYAKFGLPEPGKNRYASHGADRATAQRLLGVLLASLRAAQQSHWTSHWQVKGTSFYGDHLMFERFYGELTDQIDTLAEKMVAMFGEGSVSLPDQMKWQAYLAAQWDTYEDHYKKGYHIESYLQQIMRGTYEALKELRQLTLGMDDYLMATANAHETNQYLLGQRIGSRLARRTAKLKYKVSLFSETGTELWAKTFTAENNAKADIEALRLVKPELNKHDDAEDWVVEPAGHRGKKAAMSGEKVTVIPKRIQRALDAFGVKAESGFFSDGDTFTAHLKGVTVAVLDYDKESKTWVVEPVGHRGKKAAGLFDDAFGDLPEVEVDRATQLRWDLEAKLGETARLLAAAPMFSANVRSLIGDAVYYFTRSRAWFVYIDEPRTVAVAKAKQAQKLLRGARSVRADQIVLRGRTLYVGSNDGRMAVIKPLHKSAKTNQTIIEAPHSFHPVKVDTPKGNFEGFIDFQGLKIDVENVAGSTRKGVGPNGPWSTYMHCHYGEIRGTEGVDGDKLDVYVGPNYDSSVVVVIHQHNPWDGRYDEDKVMLGFDSVEEAVGAYKRQYDRPGFYIMNGHTAMPIGKFWRWCHDKNNKGQKVSMYMKSASKKASEAKPLEFLSGNRKGWFAIISGGDIASVTKVLNGEMIRRVPPPQVVAKKKGALKAFSFHWSNAQAKWDVMLVTRDLPTRIDGAEFILFTGRKSRSPLDKPWSLAEMRYVAKGLRPHPGYANSPESAGSRWAGDSKISPEMVARVAKQMAAIELDFKIQMVDPMTKKVEHEDWAEAFLRENEGDPEVQAAVAKLSRARRGAQEMVGLYWLRRN